MDDKPDYNLLSEIMRNANMGWWEADLQSESYVCSEYISKLLGLKEDGFISFEDFNKRILKEEQPHTTIHSFDNIQQTNEDPYGSAAKFACKKTRGRETARFTA